MLHPGILPAEVLECLKPDSDELSGLVGSFSRPVNLAFTETSAPSIVFNIHISSDGVTPFNTAKSSLRCIMGSIDSLFSPTLGLTIPVPDSPPFIIGVYQGKEKNSDIVLQPVVNELLHLSPENMSPDRTVYVRATAWIADAVERCAILGTIGTAGLASCPKCEQVGTKVVTDWQRTTFPDKVMSSNKNHVYFAQLSALPRTHANWEKYLSEFVHEVHTLRVYWN